MLRVLLLDGALAGRASLSRQLALHRYVTVVGRTSDLRQAKTLLSSTNYDAVFLDAQLGDGEALNLAAAVRSGARLVGLSRPDESTLRLFSAAGIDCLERPIQAEPLARVLEQLRAPPLRPVRRMVPVKIDRLLRFVPVDDIRLIAACENYTEVTLTAGERILVRRTMQQWVEILPGHQFARAHRGVLINLDGIGRIERASLQQIRLHFADATARPVEVNRRHWPPLRDCLELWRKLARPHLLVDHAEKSIAVLPFANIGGGPENEHFCDGISEELLNVLAKVTRLRVAARTSSFSFKGRTVPVAEIARQLGVAYVVEGSVRMSGSRVRITAQLINAADGFHVWSENFERELEDILGAQDHIASLIAANLQLQLGAAARAPRQVNPRAHWLALEGKHYWNLRTDEGFKHAEAAFTRALAIDPDFAPARAGLADVCNIRALYRLADGAVDVTDDLLRARREATRALALDASLAEARATLGFVAFHQGQFQEAEREFRQAFALNPNYATAYQYYAWTLCAQGRLDQALDVYAQGIALDPLSFINLDRQAAMLALAGRFEEALAVNERAASLRPDTFVGNLSQRAPILLALGRRTEALAVARRVRETARDTPYRRTSDADAIFVLHEAGATREAADYCASILADLPTDNYLRGFALAATGRHAEACASLRHAPNIMLPFLYWARLWDGARDAPEFAALLTRLGRTAEYATARATLERMAPSSARSRAD